MNQFDQQSNSPDMLSLMGYTLAREAGQFRKGIDMCLKAISLSPQNIEHYLNLGRIYLLANKKEFAIRTFRKGLKIRKDARIIEELRLLGIRRSPPVSSLPRDHVVNRVAGKVLHVLS